MTQKIIFIKHYKLQDEWITEQTRDSEKAEYDFKRQSRVHGSSMG